MSASGSPFGPILPFGGGLPSIVTFLQRNSDTVKALISNPAAFIVGTVVATLIGGVQTLVEALLSAITFVFFGSDGTVQPAGFLGLADLPLFVTDLLVDAGRAVGVPVLGAVQTLTDTVQSVALQFGPLAPVVATAIGVGGVVLAAVLLRAALKAATALPLVGNAIRVILP